MIDKTSRMQFTHYTLLACYLIAQQFVTHAQFVQSPHVIVDLTDFNYDDQPPSRPEAPNLQRSTALDQNSFDDLALFYREPDNRSDLNGRKPTKKITPKSIFTFKPFSHDRLPPCSDGYKSDSMGRCVNVVKVDETAKLGFLIQKLSTLTEDEDYEDEEDSVAADSNSPNVGPLQFNIPFGANDYDLNNSSQEALVTTTSTPSTTNVTPATPAIISTASSAVPNDDKAEFGAEIEDAGLADGEETEKDEGSETTTEINVKTTEIFEAIETTTEELEVTTQQKTDYEYEHDEFDGPIQKVDDSGAVDVIKGQTTNGVAVQYEADRKNVQEVEEGEKIEATTEEQRDSETSAEGSLNETTTVAEDEKKRTILDILKNTYEQTPIQEINDLIFHDKYDEEEGQDHEETENSNRGMIEETLGSEIKLEPELLSDSREGISRPGVGAEVTIGGEDDEHEPTARPGDDSRSEERPKAGYNRPTNQPRDNSVPEERPKVGNNPPINRPAYDSMPEERPKVGDNPPTNQPGDVSTSEERPNVGENPPINQPVEELRPKVETRPVGNAEELRLGSIPVKSKPSGTVKFPEDNFHKRSILPQEISAVQHTTRVNVPERIRFTDPRETSRLTQPFHSGHVNFPEASDKIDHVDFSRSYDNVDNHRNRDKRLFAMIEEHSRKLSRAHGVDASKTHVDQEKSTLSDMERDLRQLSRVSVNRYANLFQKPLGVNQLHTDVNMLIRYLVAQSNRAGNQAINRSNRSIKAIKSRVKSEKAYEKWHNR